MPAPAGDPAADQHSALPAQGLSPGLSAGVPRLLEAMRYVGAGLGLNATLYRICAIAAGLSGAERAAIAVYPGDEGEGNVEYVFHGVDEESAARIRALPEGDEAVLDVLDAPAGPAGRSARGPGPTTAGTGTSDPTTAGTGTSDPTTAGTGARAGGGGSSSGQARSRMAVPVRVHGSLFGTLCLAGKVDGGCFGDDDVNLMRALAVEAGIAIGNTRLYEEAGLRERWISGSVAVTTALLAASDADEALQVVAEQCRRVSDAAACGVLLPAETGGLEVVAVSAETGALALGRVVSGASPVVCEVLAGRAVVVEDAATDPRMTDNLARSYGPTMVLPLRSEGRVLGALISQRSRGGPRFSRTERTLAERFAAQAALALKLADAQRDRERLAVYEDRDRIARDLHDLVIQRLYATGMILESAQRTTERPEVRTGVENAVDELDVTIQEIRGAIFALQQSPRESQPGLRARILREIGMACVPLGFRPGYHFEGPVDAVGPATAKNLIAAVRETLSNAYRHARAGRIEIHVDATVRLPDDSRGVRLSVADDGVGIPEDGRRSGLTNLRRRAESLGGDSWYEGGIGPDGGGTTVIWQAPVEAG